MAATELRALPDSFTAIYTDATGARVRVTDSFITIEKRIEGVLHQTCFNMELLPTVAVVATALVERRKAR